MQTFYENQISFLKKRCHIWAAMHTHFTNDPDMKSIMIDGIIVRAACAEEGVPQRHLDEPQDQALGYSRGFTTKIHVMVDALGNPLDFTLMGGQMSDITQAYPLIEGVQATYAFMDKAYENLCAK